MPAFILRQSGPPDTYAKFNEDRAKVSFVVKRDEASAFPDKDELLAAFESSAKTMMEEAQAKLAKLHASKKKRYREDYAYDAAAGKQVTTKRENPWTLTELIPSWLARKNSLDTRFWSTATGVFSIDSQATAEDWLGSYELFYVRSRFGWLGGPNTKNDWGQFGWHSDMAKATGFLSREAAQAVLDVKSANNPALKEEAAILKASCVFTAADVPAKSSDDIALGVKSACEARAIESSIRELADGRMKALGAQASEPVKAPRRRL